MAKVAIQVFENILDILLNVGKSVMSKWLTQLHRIGLIVLIARCCIKVRLLSILGA